MGQRGKGAKMRHLEIWLHFSAYFRLLLSKQATFQLQQPRSEPQKDFLKSAMKEKGGKCGIPL